MKALIAAGALALAIAAAQPAAAAPLPQGGVTRQDIADWLQGQGLTARIHDDDAGFSIVSSSVSGVNFDVYFFSCTGERCAGIQYAAGWSQQGGVDDVDTWNRDHRYVRAYIDKQGVIWAEYDVDVSPGGSTELLDASLERWTEQIARFKAFVELAG